MVHRCLPLIIVLSIFLSGCGERDGLAPIEDLKWQPYSIHQKTYTVQKDDTLYAVAFKYDKDYRDLAIYNNLKSPYALRIGQTLKLSSRKINDKKAVQRKKQQDYKRKTKQPVRTAARNNQSMPQWLWPAKGKITSGFVPSLRRKGIDIAGKTGDKIRAASSGVVAYAGDGLSGYGNLIIIKHHHHFLTAYGNNSKNLVKEGQTVEKGQIIADMGLVNRKYWGVHFEIRQKGKPVNPLNYLKKG